MKKHELVLAIRAAGRIAQEKEFFLIGSQAIHAYCRRAPAEVLLSQECDLYPKNRVETANLLNEMLGRGSRFARQNGYYVDVVTPEIASLPLGWEKRMQVLKVGAIRVYCLEIHDLLVSKLAAGRLKDLEFTGAMLKLKVANPKVILRRIARYPIKRERSHLRQQLAATAKS